MPSKTSFLQLKTSPSTARDNGEEGEKSFFASQGSKCKHKHSPQGNELCGMEER